MAIASLDNQVIFKKLFREPDILQAFLYDLIGVKVELRPEQIELEHKFSLPIGNVDVPIALFVEDPEQRLVIEIYQEHDNHDYNLFLYYHQVSAMGLMKNRPNYELNRTLHTIVWMMQPMSNPTYHHSLITTGFRSQKEDGEQLAIYPHKLYFLNPFSRSDQTPGGVSDWLQLVLESIIHPTQPQVNLQRPEIVRSLSLIDEDSLTPQERAAMHDNGEL